MNKQRPLYISSLLISFSESDFSNFKEKFISLVEGSLIFSSQYEKENILFIKELLKISNQKNFDINKISEILSFVLSKILSKQEDFKDFFKEVLKYEKLNKEGQSELKEKEILLEKILSYKNIPYLLKEDYYLEIIQLLIFQEDKILENLEKIRLYSKKNEEKE